MPGACFRVPETKQYSGEGGKDGGYHSQHMKFSCFSHHPKTRSSFDLQKLNLSAYHPANTLPVEMATFWREISGRTRRLVPVTIDSPSGEEDEVLICGLERVSPSIISFEHTSIPGARHKNSRKVLRAVRP